MFDCKLKNLLRQLLVFYLLGCLLPLAFADVQIDSDIVFVTQVPVTTSSNNIVSTTGNHRSAVAAAPRGGDLFIRYKNGELKNLTFAAGFGDPNFQGENSIAVRDPSVHWDGDKVIFSMVVGSPSQGESQDFFWQLYEITGLGKAETPIRFTSDRRRAGDRVSRICGRVLL